MPSVQYLHDRDDFTELIRIVAGRMGILPVLVEKDYWIMHCLHGLAVQGFNFELKGGTSLSKGFGIIQRFSEDIDIHIAPPPAEQCGFEVSTKGSQTKPKHIESRRQFYDWLAGAIAIPGIAGVERDRAYDDEKYRSGGIRLRYPSAFEPVPGLKEGILLEVGFDDTTPNVARTISSWAYDHAVTALDAVTDNRAHNVLCYHPGYTFVEKLQTVSTKFRQQQAGGQMPTNFLRHYYDISQLLDHADVLAFITSEHYGPRKEKRFRAGDNLTIAENEAFLLSDPRTREHYAETYAATRSLYYAGQPLFEDVLAKIHAKIHLL